jgi:hypothetical protein
VIDPFKLLEEIDQAARDLRAVGYDGMTQAEWTWLRVDNWLAPGRVPKRGESGGGSGDEKPEDRLRELADDRAASRYKPELAALTERLASDLHRLRRIVEITNPARPKHVGSRDMLAAQAAADGWCISCFRAEQHLNPIALRPDGSAYYRDRCRACGEWRATNGEDPPLDVLRTRHAGGRVRVKV